MMVFAVTITLIISAVIIYKLAQPIAPPGVDAEAHRQEAEALRQADDKLVAQRKQGTLSFVNARFGKRK